MSELWKNTDVRKVSALVEFLTEHIYLSGCSCMKSLWFLMVKKTTFVVTQRPFYNGFKFAFILFGTKWLQQLILLTFLRLV